MDRSFDETLLCFAVTRTWSHIKHRLDNELTARHGISFIQYQVLSYLHYAPLRKMRRMDLAGNLSLSPSGITRILLFMEKSNLVLRQADPRDTRIVYALMSNPGTDLFLKAKVVFDEVSTACLELLPVVQRDEVLNFLKAITARNHD